MSPKSWPVLLAVLLLDSAALAGAQPQVVLSTDCGTEVDDQWALAHLALCREVTLRGVVTTHAPNLAAPAAETSARAARHVLDLLPLKAKPPVFPGSSEPLARKDQPRTSPGLKFLLDQSRGHTPSDRLVVVMIGAATDVASALLADPSLADRIRIVAMAFNGWPEGTDPWNVKNDVKAWQVVLESKAPLVVGDAAVTKRRLSMTSAQAHRRLDGRGPTAKELVAILDRWFGEHADAAQSVTGDRGTWVIWDEVTVAHLLGMTQVRTYPRPALHDDMTFDHGRTHGTLQWVTEIDSEQLWADFGHKLKEASSSGQK